MSTLMDFRYKRKYIAANGVDGPGAPQERQRRRADLVIRVPRGTVIRDAETNEIIHDMSEHEPFVLGQGRPGRLGQPALCHPHPAGAPLRQGGPARREPGRDAGAEAAGRRGAGGLPQRGQIHPAERGQSKAQPKIANYHFTTLFPNLGVVYVDEGVSFVMADIPGIIEGASEGAGLGHDFLRHIDRCRLLVHLVDVSGSEGRDPIAGFRHHQRGADRATPPSWPAAR